MSTVSIDSKSLREAKSLLTRLRFNRSKLGVITHVLLTSDDQGIRLAVSDLDHWLETRVSSELATPINLLIPPDALDAACRADKNTEVTFTLYGCRKSRELGLTRQSGGIEVTSVHPTLDVLEFPVRPGLEGIESQLPPETLHALVVVADCASTDSTRQVLNGVLFTPENDGNLVATDGRLLACCPAAVSQQEFILPNLAVKALGHPAFLSGVTTVTWLDGHDDETRRVAFRCGNALLVAKTIIGHYPSYRAVIPSQATELAIIPHDRQPGVITWLRSLGGDATVRLSWEKPGQLTLLHRDAEGRSAVLHVPVKIHGKPSIIAFRASHLAGALEIGGTVCLSDEISPAISCHPSGRFCVMMPLRLTSTMEPERRESADSVRAA